ncbi:MAG: SRPBCC family protein [Gemmatales bacterium]
MTEYTLRREQFIPTGIDEVFAFFADAVNLDFLTPPWLHFRIKTKLPIVMKTGTLIDYTIRWRLIPVAWRTEILDWSPPYRFVDQQIKGPYSLWHHTHTFESKAGGTLMHDIVRYRLPLGPLGTLSHALIVQRDLNAIFDYRFQRIAERFGSVRWPSSLASTSEGPIHVSGQNV